MKNTNKKLMVNIVMQGSTIMNMVLYYAEEKHAEKILKNALILEFDNFMAVLDDDGTHMLSNLEDQETIENVSAMFYIKKSSFFQFSSILGLDWNGKKLVLSNEKESDILEMFNTLVDNNNNFRITESRKKKIEKIINE